MFVIVGNKHPGNKKPTNQHADAMSSSTVGIVNSITILKLNYNIKDESKLIKVSDLVEINAYLDQDQKCKDVIK